MDDSTMDDRKHDGDEKAINIARWMIEDTMAMKRHDGDENTMTMDR